MNTILPKSVPRPRRRGSAGIIEQRHASAFSTPGATALLGWACLLACSAACGGTQLAPPDGSVGADENASAAESSGDDSSAPGDGSSQGADSPPTTSVAPPDAMVETQRCTLGLSRTTGGSGGSCSTELSEQCVGGDGAAVEGGPTPPRTRRSATATRAGRGRAFARKPAGRSEAGTRPSRMPAALPGAATPAPCGALAATRLLRHSEARPSPWMQA